MLLIFYAGCHLMEIMTSGICVYLGFSPLKIHLAFSFSLGQNHIKWAKDGINTHRHSWGYYHFLSFCRRKGKQTLSLCITFETQHTQVMVYTPFYKCFLFRDVLHFSLCPCDLLTVNSLDFKLISKTLKSCNCRN